MTVASLRDLSPSAAWQEAERRSIPFCIIGFFVTGLLVLFAGPSALQQDIVFLSAVAGAATVFFVALTVFIAYYHKKWLYGILAAILVLLVIFTINYSSLRTTTVPASFVKLVAGTAIASLF